MRINFSLSFIRALLLRMAILLVILSSFLTFLVTTNPGLKLTLRITHLLLPGKLATEALTGSIWQTLGLHTLTYTHQDQHVVLKDITLKWHIASLFPFNFVLDRFEIDQLRLNNGKTKINHFKLTGNLKRLNGSFYIGDNLIFFKGPPKGPLKIHAQFTDLKQIHPSLSGLNSKIAAEAVMTDMQHAMMTLHLAPGMYTLPKGSSPQRIYFEGASVKAYLTPEALKLSAYARLDKSIATRLNLTLPQVRLDKTPQKTQPISGEAKLIVSNFNFLDDINQIGDTGIIFQKPAGQINARIDISGVLNQPKLVGEVALTKGRLNLPELGLILNPVELTLKTDGTTWRSHGSIQSNHSEPLIFDGNGTISPNFTGSAVLTGHDVIVMETPQYYVKASPNLLLTAKPDGYEIDGNILIPKARITPVSFIHTDRLTRDAVFPDANKENPNPLHLTANIMLHMGDDVQVDVKGIQGHIAGMLHLQQEPKQALTANGEIKLVDGRYEAYGQKLNIEQGELIFMGQQIDNPGIRVRATREFKQTNAQFSGSNRLFDFSSENLDTPDLGNNTTVGVTVSGHVDSPKVKLFSSPPNLSQADILSMLLLGKPIDHADKSGGQFLIQAIKAMHLNSNSKGVKMIQDLKKSTGLDIDVKNKSLGTASSDYTKTSVSVGKSITKRIYLKYSVGLFQENSNVFTLTYLLNKFLSLKVTASDIGNGIDLTYSHSD